MKADNLSGHMSGCPDGHTPLYEGVSAGTSAEELRALLNSAVAGKLTYRELYLHALAFAAEVTRERDNLKREVRRLREESREMRRVQRFPCAEKVA